MQNLYVNFSKHFYEQDLYFMMILFHVFFRKNVVIIAKKDFITQLKK